MTTSREVHLGVSRRSPTRRPLPFRRCWHIEAIEVRRDFFVKRNMRSDLCMTTSEFRRGAPRLCHVPSLLGLAFLEAHQSVPRFRIQLTLCRLWTLTLLRGSLASPAREARSRRWGPSFVWTTSCLAYLEGLNFMLQDRVGRWRSRASALLPWPVRSLDFCVELGVHRNLELVVGGMPHGTHRSKSLCLIR